MIYKQLFHPEYPIYMDILDEMIKSLTRISKIIGHSGIIINNNEVC